MWLLKTNQTVIRHHPRSPLPLKIFYSIFPSLFPHMPKLNYRRLTLNRDRNSGTLTWQTTDNHQAVANFYQAEVIANDWEIVKPFDINPQQSQIRAKVVFIADTAITLYSTFSLLIHSISQRHFAAKF